MFSESVRRNNSPIFFSFSLFFFFAAARFLTKQFGGLSKVPRKKQRQTDPLMSAGWCHVVMTPLLSGFRPCYANVTYFRGQGHRN